MNRMNNGKQANRVLCKTFDFGVENHKDVLQHLVTESKKYILEFKYFVQKK